MRLRFAGAVIFRFTPHLCGGKTFPPGLPCGNSGAGGFDSATLASSASWAGLLFAGSPQALRVMRSCVVYLMCDGARAVKRVAAFSAKCLDAATCANGYTLR